MRLRVTWLSAEAQQWRGRISAVPGELSEPQPLGIEADEAGSLWLSGGALNIRELSPRTYNGVDIDVVAGLDATLAIELQSDEKQAATQPIEVPLAKLLTETVIQDLGSSDCQLTVARAPGDQLQIALDRDNLVYRTGESFSAKIAPRLVSAEPGTALQFTFRLRDPNGQRVIWSREIQATLPGNDEPPLQVPLEFTVPMTEGVYTADIELSAKRGLLNLGPKLSLATRSIQFVGIASDRRADARNAPSAPVTVAEIDPSKPRWWERFANMPGIPGLHRGSFGTGDTHTWQHALGNMVQLAPARSRSAPSWEAYPLTVHRLGQPHVVEIEYPSDVPQTVALSLIEPNSAGNISQIGLDSGFSVPDEAASNSPKMLVHRLIFWPRTRNPVLLIANLRSDAQAVFGKFRVLAFPGRLPVRASTSLLRERLFAGYFDRPLFPENFCAPQFFDAAAGRGLDDWNTFYQGGSRLIEYLEHIGYDGLMLCVMADGSAIYPSHQQLNAPRYDSGVLFSTGQDPVRKDVLELLARMFDREELKLIPAISFTTALSSLEELKRRGGSGAVGIEWVGPDGAIGLDRGPSDRGAAPCYNPLHPAVQQAMLAVVDEVIQRAAVHRSFVGLALQLSSDSYAQLPGLAWGFDDQTIAAFERDTGIKTTATAGARRFAVRATELLGVYRRHWAEWRTARMSALYAQIQNRLTQAHPGAKLYLAGSRMFENSDLQNALRPTLPPRSFDDALLETGVDPDLAQKLPEIVLLRPQQQSPGASRLIDLKINDSAELDRRLRESRCAAALFYHEPSKIALPSFDERSPLHASHTWLVAQVSPSADRNRQRFVHSLASIDSRAMFDGGWLLSMGQETALVELIDTFRRLPGGSWMTVSLPTQPVVIRTCAGMNQSHIYLANDSPWPVTANLEMLTGAGARLTELNGQRPAGEVTRTANGLTWRTSLRPFDLVAASISSGDLDVTTAEVVLPAEVASELASRIQDFQARAIALQSQPPAENLRNPGFELAADHGGVIPGWTLSKAAGVIAALDTQTRHAGSQSVKLTSSGGPGLFMSDEFKIPATGRTEVVLWARTETDRKALPLRVAIEGAHDGQPFYQRSELKALAPAKGNSNDWFPYMVKFDRMPLDGLSSIRLRIELLGPGDIWIDDLQLYTLRFSEDERLELCKLYTAAQVKLTDGQIADCLRLLEGYWPQFLIAHVPLTEEPVGQRVPERQAALPSKREQAPESGSGMMNWLRQRLPSILR